tara:strand:+ start:1643 stop:2458 length:816 start_codon:yes stop_codon:yes gene_type:complete
MSTLKNTNVSADGIRDVMEDFNENGGEDAVPLNGDYIADRFTRINGSTNSSAAGITEGNNGNESDTSQRSFSDAKSTMKIGTGSASWTSGGTKISTTTTLRGYGNSGFAQAVSSNGTTANFGTAYDGDNSYSNSSISFQNFNTGFDANKYFSGVCLNTSNYNVYAGFEGAGSSTSDTDWTTMYLKFDGFHVGSGQVGGSGINYEGGFKAYAFSRSNVTQIYTSYSRDLYRWSQDDSGGTIGIMELIYLFQGGGTNPDTGQQYGGNIFISFL